MMVLECLHYNYNNSETTCTGTFAECAKQITCPSGESGHHCFVVWQVGSPNPISASCNPPFKSAPPESCASECVGQQRGPRYYCCCNENLCNRNYKLPPPPQASQREPTIEVQKNFPPTSVLWSVIPIVLVVTLIGACIYRYKKDNKNAMRDHDGKPIRRSNNRLVGQFNGNELNDFRTNNNNNNSARVQALFPNSFANCILNRFKHHNNNNESINNDHNMITITTNIDNHLVDNLNNDHATTQPLINHPHHLTQQNAPNHNLDHRHQHRQHQFQQIQYNHNHQHQQQQQQQQQQYENNNLHHNQSNETRIDLSRIKLLEVIGSGRFGTVHRASLDDSNIVAVKIILSQDHQSWSNEQQVYNSPYIKHPNILKFYFSDEHLETDSYWLIVDYASKGSLHSFLEDNTLSWKEFLHIALGVVHGLSHLHEAHIVHRDFKSKNVLLRHDLSPCITDFGVAAVLDAPAGSQLDQRKKYLQVGTPRYMAPEVLECSVTFTKASFLKIDVYALSLVLWELISRCRCPIQHRSLSSSPIHQGNVFNSLISPYYGNQISQNGDYDSDYYRKQQTRLDGSLPCDDQSLRPQEFDEPPPYQLPFQDVAGTNPDIERMRQIVVVEKRRPQLREAWHDYPAAEFCRAMEDGWEYDYDARISASCVVERIEILHQNS